MDFAVGAFLFGLFGRAGLFFHKHKKRVLIKWENGGLRLRTRERIYGNSIAMIPRSLISSMKN